jgi:SAM-dependent methyltransferase
MGSGATTMFASADAYERHVGRYGRALSSAHVVAAGVQPGDRVLDVGCGPGALTEALAELTGGARVAAVDPSPAFVAACRTRVAGADVRLGSAEELPDFGGAFDVVMSQLVVNFMHDPQAGVRAMRSAVRGDGIVASCVWDYAEGMTMLRSYFDAALEIDPDAPDEGRTMRYCTPGELRELWQGCGLQDVRTGELRVEARYDGFEDLWAPFPTGVGPSGAYCASLDPERRRALHDAYFRRLGEPSGPFTLEARAWFVRGTA